MVSPDFWTKTSPNEARTVTMRRTRRKAKQRPDIWLAPSLIASKNFGREILDKTEITSVFVFWKSSTQTTHFELNPKTETDLTTWNLRFQFQNLDITKPNGLWETVS